MSEIRTKSALSDLIKETLKLVKNKDGSFKYTELIPECIVRKKEIEINDSDLPDEIKNELGAERQTIIEEILYRAVKEIYEIGAGNSRTALAVKEDRIKIKYIGKIFGNPKQNSEGDDNTSEYHFVISKQEKKLSLAVLEHPIISLRPQTLLDDNTRMILVYLPTMIKEIKDKTITEAKFENRAFFIINNPNSNTKTRQILPIEHDSLKDKFRIDVLPAWKSSRITYEDLVNWLKETDKTEPKKLFQLMDECSRGYFDYPNEFDYSYYNLWNIGTYFYELFDAFPYNDYTGTKRSGKTKALEFQKHVCFNAIMSADMSGSSVFRMIEGTGATLLLDETEQYGNKKNESAQQVRTILMQGFLKDQFAIRSEGKANEGFTPVTFNLYSPKSMAHINAFDDVLEDRCISHLMRRSKNKDMLDSWPDNKNPLFQKIRNLCYRLFLDYADEIYNLQEEAKHLIPVSGRELKLWTPIITLALFFEKHGKSGLVALIQDKAKESSEDRQIQDEQDNNDMRILRYCDDVGISLSEKTDELKNNPRGWIPTEVFYSHLIAEDVAPIYGINPEYYSRPKFTQALRRLGFKSEKKKGGISFLITKEQVIDVKERMGMIEPKQQTLN